MELSSVRAAALTLLLTSVTYGKSLAFCTLLDRTTAEEKIIKFELHSSGWAGPNFDYLLRDGVHSISVKSYGYDVWGSVNNAHGVIERFEEINGYKEGVNLVYGLAHILCLKDPN